MNTKRTPAYVFTADPTNASDIEKIATLRLAVKSINALNRQRAEMFATTPEIYRVCVKGRLGVNNPRAVNYDTYTKQSIKLADATRFDVYVQRRFMGCL